MAPLDGSKKYGPAGRGDDEVNVFDFLVSYADAYPKILGPHEEWVDTFSEGRLEVPLYWT